MVLIGIHYTKIYSNEDNTPPNERQYRVVQNLPNHLQTLSDPPASQTAAA